MRLRGATMLAMVLSGALACSDSLAAPSDGAEDLSFNAPAVRGELPSLHRVESSSRRVSAAEVAQWKAEMQPSLRAGDDLIPTPGGGEGGGGGGGEPEPALLPFIKSTFVAGEFINDQLWLNYGMMAFGTGYIAKPQVTMYGQDGDQIPVRDPSGMKETGFLWFGWQINTRELVLTPSYCGATAGINVYFEVYSNMPIGGLLSGWQTSKSDHATAVQARCPRPPEDGGGGGPIAQEDRSDPLFICYYEVWTDNEGRVVDVHFLGCRQITGGTYAE